MQNTGDEDVCAGYQGVNLTVYGLGLDALDDGLNFLIGGFALEKASNLAALCGEWGV
jgi:MOSC domain-containing protein YiiM